MVENNEPDTINYQFYLNRCERKCIIHEHIQILKCLLTLLALHQKQYF